VNREEIALVVCLCNVEHWLFIHMNAPPVASRMMKTTSKWILIFSRKII
jgi:hypothetical protein